MKILNLYAGIGGNRKLWGDEHQVTAVEIDPDIAAIYAEWYPNDTVIVGDAHQYLLDHFQEYDFIWSSPPCPSHSRFRFMTTKMTAPGKSRPIVYPDMMLYQEIILLKHYHQGKWIVENVKSYYEPLIKPQEFDRHYAWANFDVPPFKANNKGFIKNHATGLKDLHGFDISKYKLGGRKDQVLRNAVNPEAGLAILGAAKD
jgi:DNA (cytosine-5)-methyltransferase 1